MCIGCPVAVQCGRAGIEMVALEWMPDHAVYGGMDVPQLREMARMLGRADRKQARHGTRAMYVTGCRCDPCRTANAVQEAARRRRKPAQRDCQARGLLGQPCGHRAKRGSVFCMQHQLPADDTAAG